MHFELIQAFILMPDEHGIYLNKIKFRELHYNHTYEKAQRVPAA